MFQKNQGVKKAIVLYVTAILGFLILLPNGTANAHAHLSSSIPGEGETISADTRNFYLYFTSDLEQVNEVRLQTVDGAEVKYEELTLEPKNTVSIPLSQLLAEGEYVLYWDVLGEDGHTTSGEIPFQVAEQSSGVSFTSESDQKTEAANAPQTAGQQQTLLYMGILLLLVILIVGWALLRKGKTR